MMRWQSPGNECVECRLGIRCRGKERCMDVVIAVDDPRRDDVQALLQAHLAFSRAVTPPSTCMPWESRDSWTRQSRSLAPAETVCSREPERITDRSGAHAFMVR